MSTIPGRVIWVDGGDETEVHRGVVLELGGIGTVGGGEERQYVTLVGTEQCNLDAMVGARREVEEPAPDDPRRCGHCAQPLTLVEE